MFCKGLSNMDNTMILPVILAGGSGERLWPLSRTAYPKQFLTLLGAEHSLFQTTIQRLPTDSKFLAPLIVCHEEYRFIVAEQLRQVNRSSSGIILEPHAKNTAPAIALAAQWAQTHYPNAILLVLPADHLIQNPALFIDTVEQAALAATEALITFGIKITKPETGYGYIEVGADHNVMRFIEKPNLADAQIFLNNPAYLWNSGMFMFSSKTYLEELAAYQPDIATDCAYAVNACKQDLDFIRPDLPKYKQCKSLSIDYAVMEYTKKAKVFALENPWSDIGNWQAVWEQASKDNNGNCISGDVITHNSSNCLIDSRNRLVATIDVHDLAIIETSDAILIANKKQSQDLKHIVTALKSSNHLAATEHRRVMRPWGWYDSVSKGPGFQVKLISVQPGKSLSLQTHQYRSEHWVVVKGTAKIVRGDETFILRENESTFIPVGVKHQLSNFGIEDLEIIEVQSGSYLGEDDIIRYADEHGRATVSTVENA
jgi:mannose-1-phosphate guanylyltransferase/mannose-6-phosphate isomerase